MKTFKILPLLVLLALLSACSADSTPDSVAEDANGVTATKRIADSDFELRLVVDEIKEKDNTFQLEAGIRYTGDQPEVTIEHGDPLFISFFSIDGEEIGGPFGVNTILLTTSLKTNEWVTEDIVLQSSRTQIKQFYEKDGEITLNAGFSAEGYDPMQDGHAFLTLKAEEIPR